MTRSRAELQVTCLRQIPDDPILCKEWNNLVLQMRSPQVFYTYEWSLAVQRAYKASLHPRVFLAYDAHNSLCGIAALATYSEKNDVSFLCANTGDYCDFLCPPEHKRAFVAAVLAELRKQKIRRVTLTNLPADTGTVEAVREARSESGYYCFARTAYECAQVSLEKIERRSGEDQPVLPRKKMLRRFLNAMGRETPVRLDHARSFDNIGHLLPAFAQAHVARFLITGRISNLVRRERRVFLEELARLLAESGWVTLTRLVAGEKSFAWNYGFQFAGTWFWYQPTFDSDIEKYSPGFCLLAKIIEEATSDPALKAVDLGLGAEEYKDRFANQSRRTLYVTLRTSLVEHAREIAHYYAARGVKASPILERAFRTVASRFRQFNQQIDRKGLGTITTRTLRWLRESLWSEEEVFFYEWGGQSSPASEGKRLEALDANQLATAAEQYEEDAETLAYLLRSASRLRARGGDGFALVDHEGRFLHLAWTTAFEGFFLHELNSKVDAPGPNCVMLFDCWTPLAARGHGYYAETVSRIADRILKEGKTPWIFSAARNSSSLRGLEKSGFRRRYSLIRKRMLLWQRIKGQTPRLMETPVAEVSARV